MTSSYLAISMEPKLSLIIPVYNAASFILDTLTRLTGWKRDIDYAVQIILVNDGSRDATRSLIENYIQMQDPSMEICSYEVNQGKGFAVKTGMLAAVGRYRIFTDADIPFGFEAIDRILYYLDFKEFDVCIGNRKSINSKYFVKVSTLRKLSSLIFTLLISRYVVTGINDTQCGLKGFRAEVADTLFPTLRTKGFAFDVELLYYSYKYEFDIKRIPVTFEGNYESTINLTKSSVQMLWDILRLPFRYHFSKKQ
ncbi:MAG: glycosyltransferase [Saprospirales bacterium]|nr:glycosyltransferase [Saprospirales bacterium]MBK8492060.1 glycosyltransferase [Saprospirales bacterium]